MWWREFCDLPKVERRKTVLVWAVGTLIGLWLASLLGTEISGRRNYRDLMDLPAAEGCEIEVTLYRANGSTWTCQVEAPDRRAALLDTLGELEYAGSRREVNSGVNRGTDHYLVHIYEAGEAPYEAFLVLGEQSFLILPGGPSLSGTEAALRALDGLFGGAA